MLKIVIVTYSNGLALRIVSVTTPFVHHLATYSKTASKKAHETAKVVADALRVMGHASTIETKSDYEMNELTKFVKTWKETQ